MAIIRKRKDSYEITVSVGYDSKGKQLRKYMTWKPDPTLKEKQAERAAERVAEDFEQKVKDGFIMSKETVKQYLTAWIDRKSIKLAPKTIEHYKELTERIYENIGKIRLDKLKPLDIQDFYNSLATIPGKRGKIISAETQRHYHRLLSSALKEAKKRQRINLDIMAHIDPPTVGRKKPVKILDDEQSKLFVQYALNEPDIRKKVAFLLLIFSGCRIGELLGLEWQDIDFNNYTISISRTSQYVNRQMVTGQTKNESSVRKVSLPPELFELLKEYRAFCFKYSQHVMIEDNRLFFQQSGKPMFITTVNVWLKKFLEDKGLPIVSVHSLRHSNITLLIYSGIPLRQISERAGHADQSTTMRIYAHALKSADKVAAEKLAEVLPLNAAK